MFESIFTSTAQDTISIGPAMLGLLTALVLGLLIGIAYMIACKKDGYIMALVVAIRSGTASGDCVCCYLINRQ